MPEFLIRTAYTGDIPLLARYMAYMMQDMASYGGHAVVEESKLVEQFQSRAESRIQREDCLYLVAAASDGEIVGMMDASIVAGSGIFVLRELFHVHAIYVLPAYRGRGAGRQMMNDALGWARKRGCTVAELNVLVNNPAKMLYESMGFEIFQYEMLKKL